MLVSEIVLSLLLSHTACIACSAFASDMWVARNRSNVVGTTTVEMIHMMVKSSLLLHFCNLFELLIYLKLFANI